MRTTLRTLKVLALAALISGCGGDAEDRLAAAGDALREARESVRVAQASVSEGEERVAEAQQELDQARQAASEAEQALAQIETEVDVDATDALLFRAVQRRLLDDDELEAVAIRAEVKRGVISLYGEVPDGELHERAETVAASLDGVVSVDNQIEIAVAAGAEN